MLHGDGFHQNDVFAVGSNTFKVIDYGTENGRVKSGTSWRHVIDHDENAAARIITNSAASWANCHIKWTADVRGRAVNVMEGHKSVI